MDKLRYDAAPRPQTPFMNKGIVLESFKAACLLIDWAKAVTAERMERRPLEAGSGLDKWSFLEYMARPEVVSYGQIRDPQHLLQIMAGLELALLLSAEKDEAFEIRREWQKLGRWMREHDLTDPAVSGLTFNNIVGDDGNVPLSKDLIGFMIEHLPELKYGWSEGGADALNDYLYVLWLEARGG